MKTLLQINSVVNIGSTGRIAEGIGHLAISHNWDSIIAYGRNSTHSLSKLIKIGSSIDFLIHLTKSRLLDAHGFGSRYATVELLNKIKYIKPDIIHLHNIHGYYLNLEILFTYLNKIDIPVVWTLHDCWSFTGHCSYFSRIDCSRWKYACGSCPQTHEYPSSLFIDNSFKNFELKKELFTKKENLTIVPVSYWLSGLLNESFLKEKKKKVIHNGINTQIFTPKTDFENSLIKSLDKKFIILGVANIWNERKGLADFIKLSQYIESNMIIILIGLSKTQIKNLPRNIIGISSTQNQNELSEYYAAAQVFVNTTYEDNFPTTNLEALACGTPVITYNTGGSPEAIDEKTGFVVEKGNIIAVLNAISIIHQSSSSNFSQNCRERVVKLFDRDEKFKEYIELYETLL